MSLILRLDGAPYNTHVARTMRFSSEVAEIANMPWDQPDGYSAPPAFFTISRIMTSLQGRTGDAQEVFSGKATWSAEFRNQGLVADTYDIEDSAEEDVLSVPGQKTLVMRLSGLKRHAVTMWAPKCSNFVFVNMGTSGRRRDNPEGDQSKPQVRDSNRMAATVCACVRFLAAMHIFWVIEQPLNSLLFRLHVVRQLLTDLSARRISFRMVDFGAPSQKPTECWGVAPWLEMVPQIPRIPSEEKSVRLAVRVGNWVNGDRGKLKASQVYPAAFGRRMAFLHNGFLGLFGAIALASFAAFTKDIELNILVAAFGDAATGRRIHRVLDRTRPPPSSRQMRLPAIFWPTTRARPLLPHGDDNLQQQEQQAITGHGVIEDTHVETIGDTHVETTAESDNSEEQTEDDEAAVAQPAASRRRFAFLEELGLE